MKALAEYIWLDGAVPTQELRSKTRVLEIGNLDDIALIDFPDWGYDGSSTNQATGNSSDLELRPVRFVRDPIRKGSNFLVMCEVHNIDGSPHETNHRARLRSALEKGGDKHEPWIGFEQEYTLFRGRLPLGWPEGGYPAPQGPFYCGVGAEEAFGRDLVERHMQACLDAGIMLYGINAEVMPGQWEFQIGHRGFDGEVGDPLMVSDDLWLARWLLRRIGEDMGISARLDPKPIKGDWNGAGAHTNFSTTMTRDKTSGMLAINAAIERLRERHKDHIGHYGHGLEERLTGEHETARMDQFSSGISDRGASIRIPAGVSSQGFGYFEDRRPAANIDPYIVSRLLVETVCQVRA